MGATRNVVLSLVAAGLLVVGLLVLIPEPVRGAQPGAPIVSLTDVGTSSDGSIKTTVTTVVTIPQGKVIPLEYAEIIIADGTQTPTFGGALDRISSPTPLYTCVSQVTSWGGATQTFGDFENVPGYNIEPNGYGYGYEFGTPFSTDVLDGYGTGYGYGSDTKDLQVTVTVEATNCPPASAWSGFGALRTFHVQVVVGGDATHAFASVPTTIALRNPEAAAPTGTGAIGVNEQIQDSGDRTTFTLQVQAGGSLDGTDSATGSVTYTPPLGDQTTLTQAVITTNQAVPEGATITMAFQDLLGATGASFPAGSASFGIPSGDLGTRTGGVALAGFFQITMNGLPAGASAGDYLDITVTLDVPQSYFTGSLTVANFHLERYSDAGVYQGVVTCTGGTASTTEGPGGTTVATYRFTCAITSFSSFAMVASAITSGGGGGGGGAPTTPPPPPPPGSTTLTTTSTGTATATGTSTVTGTQSNTGTTTPKPKGGSAPGLELGLVAVGLVALALVARRKMK